MDEELIQRHALANAVKYKGKANQGAVLGAAIKELGLSAKELQPTVAKIVTAINALALHEQEKLLQKLGTPETKRKRREGLPELPDVKGKVVMRFAPFPSGPLHLGNTKTLILNDEYVKKYGGKLILFYDDTIGSKEKTISKEAYDLIKEGAEWMGVTIHEEQYKSKRMDLYYKYADEIIEKDKAYVCTCVQEVLRDNRRNGKDCSCRKLSKEKTKQRWQDMMQGKYEEGTAVLRIKTSMQDKNPAFRDRVLFRISNREHPLVGNKYHVWPLLEFSMAIDDHLLGMTHILRGKDLMMETEMQHFIWDIFGWEHPTVIHNGLIQIEGVKISKSKSKQEVESGQFSGWDDPRTWSIQSLRKRGITPEAIRKFLVDTGLKKSDVHIPVDALYSENRKLAENAPRYFFINDPMTVEIKNAPNQTVTVPVHPDHPEQGNRTFTTNQYFFIQTNDFHNLEEGKLYRLMDCLNFTKQGKELVFHSTDYEQYKTRRGRIMHWLPKETGTPIVIIMDDGSHVDGIGEDNTKDIKPDQILQFERFGFVRCEKPGLFYYTHG